MMITIPTLNLFLLIFLSCVFHGLGSNIFLPSIMKTDEGIFPLYILMYGVATVLWTSAVMFFVVVA